MHIVVTEVDYVTKIPCTVEPQRTGPSMPEVKGLKIIWDERSKWPVEVAQDGTYLRAPKYYGICDDDADTNIPGVLEVLTEEVWNSLRVEEHEARKPYPSWIGYLSRMTWGPPIARPIDDVLHGGDVFYEWDESKLTWVPMENTQT